MRGFIAALLLTLGVSGAGVSMAATPTISSVTGDRGSGDLLTITGTNYGTGPDVVLMDDFELGVNGDQIGVGEDSIARVGQWHSYGDIPDACDLEHMDIPTYANDRGKSGTLSYLYDTRNATGNSYDCPRNGLLTQVNSNEIFQSWWVWIPTDTCIPTPSNQLEQCGGSNWKMTWLLGADKTTQSSDRYTPVTIGTTAQRSGGNSGDSHYLSNFTFVRGSWWLLQAWHYADAVTGVGDIWIGGIDNSTYETWTDKTSVNIQDSGSWSGAYSFYDLGGYGNDVPDSHHAFFDDIYLAQGANARARVMLGNASTLAASTDIVMCTTGSIPDSWSTTQIVCTLRSDRAETGDMWVYVVNGDGETSTGYKLDAPFIKAEPTAWSGFWMRGGVTIP